MAIQSNTKKFLWVLVIPLVLTIVVTIVLFFMFGSDVASIFSIGATLAVMLGALGYVVFWDSKRRWPELTPWERYTKVITFQK